MKRHIRCTLMLVLLPVIVHAQSKSISLEEAVALFKQNSLQQELARYDRLRKQGEAIHYKAYPNPRVNIYREQLNAGPLDFHETIYQISQPIELLGQPFLRNQSTSKSQKAAELQFEYDRLQLIRQVKVLYTDYWQLTQKLKVYNHSIDIIRKAQRAARDRQAEGTFSELQVQRFNVELSRYRKQRNQVQINLDQTGNRLATYLFPGQNMDTRIRASDSLTVTPLKLQEEALIQYALAHRADIKALEQLIDASELQYRVERRERFPDLIFNIGYKDQSDGSEGFVIGGTFAVPIFNQNSGNVAISRARNNSRQTQLILKKQSVRNQVQTTLLRVQLIKEQWESMQANGMQNTMIEAARDAYRQGRYSLVELLDATQTYIDGQTMIYETIADYNRALHELDVQVAGRISEYQTNK